MNRTSLTPTRSFGNDLGTTVTCTCGMTHTCYGETRHEADTRAADLAERHAATHRTYDPACAYKTSDGDRDVRAAQFAAYCGDNGCACTLCATYRNGLA